MTATPCNPHDYLSTAERYYHAMLAQDFETMAGYLHERVQLIGPLAQLQGRTAVVQAAKNFAGMLQDIHIRSRFANGDQIMFAYDMILPEPIGPFRAAVRMVFTDQLISTIELFYDAQPFAHKKNDIFEG